MADSNKTQSEHECTAENPCENCKANAADVAESLVIARDYLSKDGEHEHLLVVGKLAPNEKTKSKGIDCCIATGDPADISQHLVFLMAKDKTFAQIITSAARAFKEFGPMLGMVEMMHNLGKSLEQKKQN